MVATVTSTLKSGYDTIITVTETVMSTATTKWV